MIVTVSDASPRQAQGHIGDGCVKWEHFLNDVADVADKTGTVRGRIERVEMSLKRVFHVIITMIVSICHRLIGDTPPKRRRLLQSYGNQAIMLGSLGTTELRLKHLSWHLSCFSIGSGFLFLCHLALRV